MYNENKIQGKKRVKIFITYIVKQKPNFPSQLNEFSFSRKISSFIQEIGAVLKFLLAANRSQNGQYKVGIGCT